MKNLCKKTGVVFIIKILGLLIGFFFQFLLTNNLTVSSYGEYTDYTELYTYSKIYKKKLEILKFKGNITEVKKRGKGYGEGEIIEFALKNSKYLKNEEDYFYKFTGRVFIENINVILKENIKVNNFLVESNKLKIMDTKFFKIKISDYKKYLIDKYKEVNDFETNYLEHVFYKYLSKVDEIKAFKNYPKYIGISGSTGKKYTLGRLKYLKQIIKLKLGYMDIKNEKKLNFK
ncbi:MAG: hypothetical protein ACRCY7_02870 [Cetobacterium sp.]|uniref:hypothetical protein n=1 Tax=Cetobacterium sp. TaxID=2071632 RepID=UPI003F3AEA92